MTFRSLVPIPFASWFRRMSFPLSPPALLLTATVAALVWANAFGIHSYHAVWEFQRGWLPGTPKEWINDGLMALFFLLIGVEIKRELTVGALDSPRRALLPAAAAFGGMAAPATIYLALNWPGDGRGGWGIPMATDIAFVLGILGALGARASNSGRVFITALAVVDDIGAILVIAIFYSSGVSLLFLAVMAALIGAMLAMNRSGKFGPLPILVLGIALWACALESGIHPTLAGLLVGLLLPARGEALERIEHAVEPWVSRAIVPLFALANAGVAVSGGASLFTDRVAIGVFLGLVVGKPLGIMATTLAAKAFAREGDGSLGTPSSLFGFSMLGGVGFTMSLFIAELAFGDCPHGDAAKLGILAASVVAAISGFGLLRREPVVQD
jgi:NhaA family Na+:H+ antiporter